MERKIFKNKEQKKENDIKQVIGYKFKDPIIWQRLIEALQVGSYIEDACRYAGISSRQFRTWRSLADDGVEPYASKWEEVRNAESVAIISNLANIKKAGQDGSWQASAWLLERKYPDKFARRDKVELQTENKKFDVELYWADGNIIDVQDAEVVDVETSETSDTKKEKKKENEQPKRNK